MVDVFGAFVSGEGRGETGRDAGFDDKAMKVRSLFLMLPT
jgi:hypothetical protein